MYLTLLIYIVQVCNKYQFKYYCSCDVKLYQSIMEYSLFQHNLCFSNAKRVNKSSLNLIVKLNK